MRMGQREQVTRRNEGREREAGGFETAEELGRCEGEQRRSWQDPDVLWCDWRDSFAALVECVSACRCVCECTQERVGFLKAPALLPWVLVESCTLAP